MTNLKIINSASDIAIKAGWQNLDSFKSKNRCVTENGTLLESTYRGIRYQVVAKHIREFGVFERIGRITLALLCTIPTLGLVLFSKGVRKLFTKSYESITFALFAHTPQGRRIESAPVQERSEEPIHFQKLRAALKAKPCPCYITNSEGSKQQTIVSELGEGGSKTAFQLEDEADKEKVVLLPNMSVDPLSDIAKRWERMVDEEVSMSQHLRAIGLLCCPLEKVSVSSASSSNKLIPAYTTDSFKSLAANRGWFIIDVKNPKSSIWTGQIFKNEVDPYVPQNWDLPFRSLTIDIAKLVYHNIPIGHDSCNLAIVKKSTPTDDLIEVRYFGFDFSDKNYPLQIPSHLPNLDDKEHISEMVDHILEKLLDTVLIDVFFKNKFIISYSDRQKNLKQELLGRYKPEILRQIREVQCNNILKI